MFFKRYDKHIMEPFAIKIIEKSFDEKYGEYLHPLDDDDFDYVSPDGMCAVEMVSVIPPNEINVYKYEMLLAAGKKPRTTEIKGAAIKEDGNLLAYHGGSLTGIMKQITECVRRKSEIAKRRMENKQYMRVDLCVSIQDGGLMDLRSYQIMDFEFSQCPFENIFFITRSCFIRYSEATSFEEYPRRIL